MLRLGQLRNLCCLSFVTHGPDRFEHCIHFSYDKCPKSLHYLQSLSFLPHVLNIHAPWPVLDVQTVANRCGIHSECFSHSDRSLHKHWPIHLSLAYFVPKSSNIVWKKQDCCTALRNLTTWNVSGWRTLQWTNPKTQAILRRARKGIVCLQETRWTASTALISSKLTQA